ncbi:MAG: SRPBCC domain-containing protein [Gemmatimonadetes bacterium]|nr:SRPBCC domain-containing protein [Gemmatimonadota bacterium]
MKKILIRVFLVALVLFAGVYGAGMTMPREHSVASRIQLTAPRDSVWAVLRAFGDYPKWDKDFKSSVRGPSRNGHEVWVQDIGWMTMSIEFLEVRPPSRLVTEIVTDEKSDWGGVWTYDLVANGTGTEVTFTEDGWIKSPVFRVLMKAMGTHSTMDGVLKNLGARFGEQVTPEHVK